jgi:hypothetical protein
MQAMQAIVLEFGQGYEAYSAALSSVAEQV